MPTDFPTEGDDMKVSLRNSQYDVFDRQFAERIKEDYPEIWEEGGNIKGDDQYRRLTKVLDQGKVETDTDEQAVRDREAWAARHFKDFRLPGVVAQMKWLVVGSRGEDHMKEVIREEIDSIEEEGGDKVAEKPDKTIVEIDEFKQKLKKDEDTKDVAVRKQQNVEVKEVDNQDRVLRFISSDQSRDRDGDTINPKGWDLENFNKNPVFLWAHDYSTPPLGKVVNTKLEDDKKKQDVKFIDPEEMYPETEYKNLPDHVKFADMVYRMYKSGDMNAVSVGFDPIDYEYSDDKGGNIDFKEQEQLELSAVPVPSNPNALQVAGMKGVDDSIMKEWAKSVLKSTQKIRETPRNPVYEDTETSEDISWADIDKDLETFLTGYYENTENEEPDEMPTQVSDLTEDAKDWIANRTLLGEADAENVRDLIFFPVVNPLTNNLHEGALRAVISGRGQQADIPD
uniref:HK97 family phage prohead protease n=1 Tax=Methanohalobium sp. TaxID=2837493 RepID=UPI0025CD3F70